MTVAENSEKQVADRWLAAELNRIWLVAERALRSLQKAQIRPQPGHPSLTEVEAVLGARRAARLGASAGSGVEDEASLNRAIAEVEQSIGELRKAAPIGRLVDNLQLRPLEIETLISAMAPHIDAPLANLFHVLRGVSSGRRGVDLALLAQMFRLKRANRIALLDALDPDRPLMRWGLIQVLPDEALESFGSLSHRAIRPSFQLISMLCGRPQLDPHLARCMTVSQTEPTLDDIALSDSMRQEFAAVCEAARAYKDNTTGTLPWMLFWGPTGAGKRELSRKAAAYAGKPLVAFNPTVLDSGTFEAVLQRVKCEAILRDAMLYIGPLGAPLLNEGAHELVKRMLDYRGMLAVGIDTMQPPRVVADHPILELQIRLPPEDVRMTLWQESMPEDRRGEDVRLDVLSRTFNLTPGEIVGVSRESLLIARGDKDRKVTHADLRGGVERRLRNELGDFARQLTITVSWDDLVLGEQEMARVQEFISRRKHRGQVYDRWGFGDRVGYAKGLVGLFSGPPGTGKTMLALLIAKSLDLDIYQVDLSKVLSKWVGETEKQLAKVFDQAERAQAMLLFDEADSLFAKRTEVKTSNDRYGNLATNYLLQRLEQYEGVAVLTTNKEASLDEALQRRLSLHLHLDIPEVKERERLWHSFIPPDAPAEKGLDFHTLAHEFELSGGYIKNAAVRAAFLAAARDVPISMGLLYLASELELEDMGRVVWRSDESADQVVETSLNFTDS